MQAAAYYCIGFLIRWAELLLPDLTTRVCRASSTTPLLLDGELPAGFLSPSPLQGLLGEGSLSAAGSPVAMLGVNGHAAGASSMGTPPPPPPGKCLTSHALAGDLAGRAGRCAASSDSGSSEGPDFGRASASGAVGAAAVPGTPHTAQGSAPGDASTPPGGAGVGVDGADREEVLARLRELVDKALKGPLLPAQQQQVVSALARVALAWVLGMGVSPAMLPALVEHAPLVAYELLVKLMDTHLISDYYMVLATSGAGRQVLTAASSL